MSGKKYLIVMAAGHGTSFHLTVNMIRGGATTA